jgi:hypothetical protein
MRLLPSHRVSMLLHREDRFVACIQRRSIVVGEKEPAPLSCAEVDRAVEGEDG